MDRVSKATVSKANGGASESLKDGSRAELSESSFRRSLLSILYTLLHEQWETWTEPSGYNHLCDMRSMTALYRKWYH